MASEEPVWGFFLTRVGRSAEMAVQINLIGVIDQLSQGASGKSRLKSGRPGREEPRRSAMSSTQSAFRSVNRRNGNPPIPRRGALPIAGTPSTEASSI